MVGRAAGMYAMTVFLLCMLTLSGLVIGSFLNVVGYRVPRGESLNSPPSHCPACGHPIRNRHNVPVVGWLVLRGRCADCAAPISVRYPLVEAATGLLFLLAGLRTSIGELPAVLYFTAIGIALALIDVDTGRLPNAITLPSYPVLALLVGFAAWWRHDWWSWGRAGLGGVAWIGLFLVLAAFGTGAGDVKLAGLAGLLLGSLSWSAVLFGAVATFLLGGLTGVVVLARGGTRKTMLPFGPFAVAGTLLAAFVPL